MTDYLCPVCGTDCRDTRCPGAVIIRQGKAECSTPGCSGDARYAPPGRGHTDDCTDRNRAALAKLLRLPKDDA